MPSSNYGGQSRLTIDDSVTDLIGDGRSGMPLTRHHVDTLRYVGGPPRLLRPHRTRSVLRRCRLHHRTLSAARLVSHAAGRRPNRRAPRLITGAESSCGSGSSTPAPVISVKCRAGRRPIGRQVNIDRAITSRTERGAPGATRRRQHGAVRLETLIECDRCRRLTAHGSTHGWLPAQRPPAMW